MGCEKWEETSCCRGVYFDQIRFLWRANWPEESIIIDSATKRMLDIRRCTRTKGFSAKKYGFQDAQKMAIEHRAKMTGPGMVRHYIYQDQNSQPPLIPGARLAKKTRPLPETDTPADRDPLTLDPEPDTETGPDTESETNWSSLLIRAPPLPGDPVNLAESDCLPTENFLVGGDEQLKTCWNPGDFWAGAPVWDGKEGAVTWDLSGTSSTESTGSWSQPCLLTYTLEGDKDSLVPDSTGLLGLVEDSPAKRRRLKSPV